MPNDWPDSIIRHVVDVHCHPTDSPACLTDDALAALPITVCAMATRQDDQQLVRDLAMRYPEKVVPCFGYHPWFTHWISLDDTPLPKEQHYRSIFFGTQQQSQSGQTPSDVDVNARMEALQRVLPSLPEPIPLKSLLSNLRDNLTALPNAMVGEVGLDRTCRIPFDYRNERRELSPFNIPLEHQLVILEAQIDLAVELGRNVSMHSVKAAQVTLDMLLSMKSRHGYAWNQISVDMHSCGLSAQTWRNIEKIHSNIFLSLSTVINGRSSAHKSLLLAASLNRILVESDIHEIHQCAQRTWDMVRIFAEVRGLEVEQIWVEEDQVLPESDWGAVRRLEENWKLFKMGRHQSRDSEKERKKFQKRGFDWNEPEGSEDEGN